MSFIAALSAIVFAIVETVGIVTALHAILFIRSVQGAIAWAIGLITFPWAAIPLYWVFGRNKFNGYVEALRAGNIKSSNLLSRVTSEMKKYKRNNLADEELSLKNIYDVFSGLSGFPFTGNNSAKLLKNGSVTFKTIFDYIENAKDYILLEFFIVRNDETGNKIKNILIKKAFSGVRVFFLYDEIGSRTLEREFIEELEEAGCEMKPFFTTRGRRNRFQLNFRNHRKIVVVDGKFGFVGGHNVGDEYMGKSKKYGFWRDTHLLIEGPAVLGVQLTFVSDWFWAVRKGLDLNWTAHKSENSDMEVLPIPTDPSHKLDTCLLFFLNAIVSAKDKIWIASPYFVPDDSIIEALQLAALRGVDVRIILPGVPDKKIAYFASFAYLSRLSNPNIKIYRYLPGFMHQKVMVADDKWAVVGSANFDNRSFYLNFEMNLLVKDEKFAYEVKSMLEEDMRSSEFVIYPDQKMSSWFFRLAVRLSSLFSPVL